RLYRAGVSRAVRAGLHPGRGDQPGARQGAEGAQDRRQRLRPAGGAVRVRAAARLFCAVRGAERGAGPDPVPDQDGFFLYRVENGEVSGIMRPAGASGRWLFGTPVTADTTPERCVALIRAAVGDPGLD